MMVTPAEYNGMSDRSAYDVLDPNTGQPITLGVEDPNIPIFNARPREQQGGGMGPKPAAAPMVPEPGLQPGASIIPQPTAAPAAGTEAGGNVQLAPAGALPDYLQAARNTPLVFKPDRAALAAKGFTDKEIDDAMAELGLTA